MSRASITLDQGHDFSGVEVEIHSANSLLSLRENFEEAVRQARLHLDVISPTVVPDKKNLGFIPGQGEANANSPV